LLLGDSFESKKAFKINKKCYLWMKKRVLVAYLEDDKDKERGSPSTSVIVHNPNQR